MINLAQTARNKMRESYARADAHRQFVAMFACAGMTRLAESRLKDADSESAMVGVWSGFCAELAACSMKQDRPTQPPKTLKDIIDAIAAHRGVTLYR